MYINYGEITSKSFGEENSAFHVASVDLHKAVFLPSGRLHLDPINAPPTQGSPERPYEVYRTQSTATARERIARS